VTIATLVKPDENIFQFFHLLLAFTVAKNVSHNSCLEGRVSPKLLQVVTNVQKHILRNHLLLNILSDPFVLQQGVSVHTLLRVTDQHFAAESFRFLRGVFPDIT